jgi:rhodanese-related sulfurtransferase
MNTRILAALLAGVSLAAWNAQAGCGACGGHADKEAKQEKKAEKTELAAKTVDTAGVKKVVDADDGTVIIDARSGKWDDGKRIGKAKSLNADSSDADIAAALPAKDAKIITYCAGVKCPASAKLAEKLHKLGYQDVTEYPEGIAGWVESGHPVTETKKN